MLLNEPHFFVLEDFIGICLLVDFLFLSTVLLLEVGNSLMQLELVDLLLEFMFLCFSKLLPLLILE